MKALLIQGSISKWIWTLAWPMLIGFLSLASVPLIDVILLSKLGIHHQAMISLILPMTLVAIGLPAGLNIALSSQLARYIGEGKQQKIGPVFTFACMSMVLLSVLVALFVTFSGNFIYELLGAQTEESFALLTDYFVPWIWGWCLVALVVSINAIFRCQGLTRPVSAIMIFNAAIHIIADLILIDGMGDFKGWGMSGAGWAEVITGWLTLLFSFYYQKRLNTLQYWQLKKAPLRDLLLLLQQMLASTFAYILPVASQILLQRALVSASLEALSVYGAMARIETVGTMTIMSISSALPALVAQNKGAGFVDRCRQAFLKGIMYGTFFGVAYVIFIYLTKDFSCQIFHIQGGQKALFENMLQFFFPAWLLWGITLVPLGGFYGLGRSQWVLLIGFVRLVFLFVFLQLGTFGPLTIIGAQTLLQGLHALLVFYGLWKLWHNELHLH